MHYTNWLDYLNLYSYYPNPYFWGALLFFLVPLGLWFIGSAFIPRPELSAKVLAFIAGSDNRLSLSRLQAFAWTLIIFGSFVAAMTIHTRISPTTEAEHNQQLAEADRAAKNETHYQNEMDKAWAAYDKTPDETTKAAKDAAEQRYDEAHRAAQITIVQANNNNWVGIPGALLLLAGIAIGSGVFSSLISAVNAEAKTACVTGIKPITAAEFIAANPNSVTTSTRLLQITGRDMGEKDGKVRFGKGKMYSVYTPILSWKSDGTEIIVDVPDKAVKYDTLVVDTPNGKLSYELTDTSNGGLNMQLGIGKYFYEFSDLFRNDKNPMVMDLMKFQMFGWTIVAIAVYSWLFLNDLNDHIGSLPLVPPAIVILTGVSQAGYLAGKSISNIQEPGK